MELKMEFGEYQRQSSDELGNLQGRQGNQGSDQWVEKVEKSCSPSIMDTCHSEVKLLVGPKTELYSSCSDPTENKENIQMGCASVEKVLTRDMVRKTLCSSTENLMRFAEILYKCTLCTSLPSILTSKDNFLSHVKNIHLEHHNLTSRHCTQCALSFQTGEDLNAHMSCDHTGNDIIDVGSCDMAENEDQFSCKKTEKNVQKGTNECTDKCFESHSKESKRPKLEQEQLEVDCSISKGNYASERGFNNSSTTFKRHFSKHSELSNNHSDVNFQSFEEIQPHFTISHHGFVRKPEETTGLSSPDNPIDYSVNCRRERLLIPKVEKIQARVDVENFHGDGISKLQHLTNYMMQNSVTGIPMPTAFTPEFGKFTKLIREGGNIVYFCQVCNWKCPIKSNFQIHCDTEGHKSKVKMAEDTKPRKDELGPNEERQSPAKDLKGGKTIALSRESEQHDFSEPRSWSPHVGASCRSLLVEKSGLYIDHRETKSDKILSFHSKCNVEHPYLENRSATEKEVNSNCLRKALSQTCDMDTCDKKLVPLKLNRRKRHAPTSVRNLTRNFHRLVDSDSSDDENDDVKCVPPKSRFSTDSVLSEPTKKKLLQFIQDKMSPEHRNVWGENSLILKGDSYHSSETEVSSRNCQGSKDLEQNNASDIEPKPKPTTIKNESTEVILSSLKTDDASNDASCNSPTQPQSKFYKCFFCRYEYSNVQDYTQHFETMHGQGKSRADDNGSSDTAPDGAVDGNSCPNSTGELWKVHRLKQILPELLYVCPRGNVSRDLLLQKISCCLGDSQTILWGPACNKAMREVFPGSLAQRKGKYKKTYFFGVDMVDATTETAEDLSDAETVPAGYQPLRDMSQDVEKLLEYLPTVLTWTGNMYHGVSRDQVLNMLIEKFSESEVKHWGSQCNRAIRFLYPDVEMKRKGKYKTTVFFGVDFIEGMSKQGFIPNKRGRPRKQHIDDERFKFLSKDRERMGCENVDIGQIQLSEPSGLLRMARTKNWLTSIGYKRSVDKTSGDGHDESHHNSFKMAVDNFYLKHCSIINQAHYSHLSGHGNPQWNQSSKRFASFGSHIIKTGCSTRKKSYGAIDERERTDRANNSREITLRDSFDVDSDSTESPLNYSMCRKSSESLESSPSQDPSVNPLEPGLWNTSSHSSEDSNLDEKIMDNRAEFNRSDGIKKMFPSADIYDPLLFYNEKDRTGMHKVSRDMEQAEPEEAENQMNDVDAETFSLETDALKRVFK
ncbi:hypothetical protein CHS0354_004722 [Potamilus streckersoni]|uniref:C2H2-type domain-containing protein n=1 Tax=Potamilus streckersoni TaxID=2493646 RepID=A0AAE0W5V1_9BIVA|nr:hypothetical protein CHS0354_004722 [Potamilus streckersoni]